MIIIRRFNYENIETSYKLEFLEQIQREIFNESQFNQVEEFVELKYFRRYFGGTIKEFGVKYG